MDDLFNYLLGLIQSIAGYLEALFAFLAQFVEYVAIVLYDILAAVVSFLYGLVKILISSFGHIIHDIITGNFSQLWQDVQNLRAALAAYIQPMLQAIRAEQLYLQHLFNLYLGPLLNFLQDIRKVLAVFRAMGFKWATTLDNYIAGLEGKITGAFQSIVQALNRHADFFYLLMSPSGFLRLVPLIHSAGLAAEDIYRLFTGRAAAFWRGTAPTGAVGSLPVVQQDAAWSAITAGTSTGQGDGAAVQASMVQLQQMIATEIGA